MGMRIERAHRLRWVGFLVCGAALAFAIHCGSSEDSTFSECQAIVAEGCGAPCATDGECGSGLGCTNGACNAVCGASRACTNGFACNARGQCEVPGFGDQPQDGGPNGPSDGCVDLTVDLGRKTPTIVLLVDRSGSMEAAFGSAGTRWDVLKSVILDGGVVRELQGEVQFGLSMYSNATPAQQCPNLEGVPFAANNYDAIRGVLQPAVTRPDTPTGESILRIAGLTDAGLVDGGLAALDAGGGEKVILLITDGDPDYCANPAANDPPLNGSEVQKAKDIAVAAAQRAFAAGIKTYVLAIGNEVAVAHQQEMANVGLGYPRNAADAAPFFRPNDQAQLLAQINQVITGTRSCKYTLNGTVQPGFEPQGLVTLNGQRLGYGDPNGWRLPSANEIELVGQACETVRTAVSATLTASFPCGGVIVR